MDSTNIINTSKSLIPDANRAPVQTDAFEFKYILKGKVQYTVGSEIFMMEPGD